jgi:hypothetical protein
LASLRRANTADHAAEIGVMGLLTKPSFSLSKMSAPTERSSAPSALELALVHRLASLLWRLRRACAIETGLFEMQGEIRSARRQIPSRGFTQPGAPQIATGANGDSKGPDANRRDDVLVSDQEPLRATLPAALGRRSKSRTIAQRFLRLSNLDPTLVDRASNYEERLWRQATQTILTLDAMRRPPSAPARRLFRRPMVLSYRDLERSRMR